MDKSPNNRKSPLVQDRDSQLAAEANAWARMMVEKFFDVNRIGFFLPSDILAWLDNQVEAPTAWLRWLDQYQFRYNMVRNCCVSMNNRGALDTRTEVNARGRDSTSYQRSADVAEWDVVVSPSTPELEGVVDLVRGWLKAHPKNLRRVTAISITRKSEVADVKHHQAGSRAQKRK